MKIMIFIHIPFRNYKFPFIDIILSLFPTNGETNFNATNYLILNSHSFMSSKISLNIPILYAQKRE